MTAQIAAYGRLGNDPRQHDTRTGKAMTTASLVCSVEARGGGDEAEGTLWLGIVALGTVAEDLARHGRTGERVWPATTAPMDRPRRCRARGLAVHRGFGDIEPERSTEGRAAHRRRRRPHRHTSDRIEDNPGRVEPRPRRAHRPRERQQRSAPDQSPLSRARERAREELHGSSRGAGRPSPARAGARG